MSGLPEVGARFGRYQIQRLIAQHDDRAVYEAVDAMLRRSVTLTVIGSGSGLDEEALHERVTREATVLARIRSRNVVRSLGHGVVDGVAYLATEYFVEGDLDAWLHTHGVMPRTQALGLVSQVCGALAVAHAAGVVHGDLTLYSILLRAEPDGPTPYVSGFGPGSATASEQADVAAVGRLLLACVTGDTGLSGIAADPGVESAINDARVDPELRAVVRRALSTDPAGRYAGIAELRAAVDELAAAPTGTDVPPDAATPREPPAAEPPVTAAPAPTLPTEPIAWPVAWPSLPTQPAPRRSRWPIAVGAVVVLLLLAGAAVVAVTRGDDGADTTLAVATSPSATVATTASATPSPTSALTPSTPTSTAPSTTPPAPAVATTPPAPPARPAIGRLTRSSAACTGTVGDYQKWQYPLTGFAPGRTLHPQLAIRSDHGSGEAAGKPVTVSRRGTATGDFCVPAGTHGTVTITVGGATVRRPIG